ncbi:Mrm2 protein [Candida orthopsilosis Co 90-125]|uniref:rRNA methyltransferase 2, mitochondrial n=1 Tax=Candida orthopsilosis (strain 90-125) TaxID=1136231 RepID=H8X4H1_CANO9|nr:Mrm2 protein [Candida orthopsilosis Co 90-125]CCG22913.1 Mrm2 protein [Candida orthopsilosis Co 90-125]
MFVKTSPFRHSIARHKSSSLKKHFQKVKGDPFNEKKRGEFYRSRAAFKLLEIDEKYHLFNKNCHNIVDLGFAPGAWSQVAVENLGDREFTILGIDINHATPYKGCHYIQGDVTKTYTHSKIREFFTNDDGSIQPLDLIMSDMMINCTGHDHYDHLGNMELCNAGLILAFNQLRVGGNMVMKVWQGSELMLLEARMKVLFSKQFAFKPKSSRSESSELYFVGLGRRDLEYKVLLSDLFSDLEDVKKLQMQVR